jgi:hypothetical protein
MKKFLLILLLLCVILSSCGISKKSQNNYIDTIDSSFNKVKKDTEQTKKDSIRVEKKEAISQDATMIKIDFQDSQNDSAAKNNVTIKTDTAGTLIINTGGKKIKSITATKKHTELKSDSDSTKVMASSQVQKIDSTKTDIKKNVKENTIKKYSFTVPWYVYIIIISAGFCFWFFYPNIMALKRVVK